MSRDYFRVTFTDGRRRKILVQARSLEEARVKAEREARSLGTEVADVTLRFTSGSRGSA